MAHLGHTLRLCWGEVRTSILLGLRVSVSLTHFLLVNLKYKCGNLKQKEKEDLKKKKTTTKFIEISQDL